jgi:lysyl-tRNA synthetase class 2
LSDQTKNPPAPKPLSQVLQDRRNKLQTWRGKNINPYANDFGVPTHTSLDVRSLLDAQLKKLAAEDSAWLEAELKTTIEAAKNPPLSADAATQINELLRKSLGANHTNTSGLSTFEQLNAQLRELIGQKNYNNQLWSIIGAQLPEPTGCKIAGRMVSNRVQGKLGFGDLLDRNGKIQVMAKVDHIGAESLDQFKSIDEGDFIGIEGTPMLTKMGEPTVAIKSWKFLTKNLLPIGDKFHGITDTEARYRRRYSDLVADWQSPDKKLAIQEIFRRRTEIIKSIRAFFDARDFLEVETPMLHHGVTGASARPFKTHHNALDLDLRLRIAPELYLKRLLVGGLERVYEIGRNFRNEGISTHHNPEFTMMEFYWAYATYEELITLTEELFVAIGEKMLEMEQKRVARGYAPIGNVTRDEAGDIQLKYGSQTLSLKRPFARFSMVQAIVNFFPESTYSNIVPKQILEDSPELTQLISDEARLAKLLEHRAFEDVKSKQNPTLTMSYGQRLAFLFEHIAEPLLIQPTFITDFPLDISPLSRKKESNPVFVDRFEMYAAGREIANAFSELNDPDDQKQRFQAQLAAKAKGDEEAMDYDADYITALEVGMPPAAGQGIGIDRLVMLFTDEASIREVIFFPLLRPESQ